MNISSKIRGGRITYIDSLKGLLILLVIIGHSNVNLVIPKAVNAIYTFHMPLFFILSGYFLRVNESAKSHLKKSFKSYILPYLYTCLIGVALRCAKWCLTGDMKYEGHMVQYLHKIALVQVARTDDIGPIWFLVALFWSQNILVILKSRLSHIQLCCGVMALAVCSLLLWEKVFVPFSLLQGISALPYLLIGFLLKSNMDKVQKLAKDKWCLLSIGLMWIAYVLVEGVMRISYVSYHHGCTAYIVSVSISLVILYYSKYIDVSWLRRIGRHTLLILCVHTLVIPCVFKIGYICPSALWTLLEMIADIIASLLISYLFVKVKNVLINGNTSQGA